MIRLQKMILCYHHKRWIAFFIIHQLSISICRHLSEKECLNLRSISKNFYHNDYLKEVYYGIVNFHYHTISFIPPEMNRFVKKFTAITSLKQLDRFSCLTHLTFGKKFNKPVDNLPKNLTHLTFGKKFNKPVDNLPKKPDTSDFWFSLRPTSR